MLCGPCYLDKPLGFWIGFDLEWSHILGIEGDECLTPDPALHGWMGSVVLPPLNVTSLGPTS